MEQRQDDAGAGGQRAVVGLFEDGRAAERAAARLTEAGFAPEALGYVAPEAEAPSGIGRAATVHVGPTPQGQRLVAGGSAVTAVTAAASTAARPSASDAGGPARSEAFRHLSRRSLPLGPGGRSQGGAAGPGSADPGRGRQCPPSPDPTGAGRRGPRCRHRARPFPAGCEDLGRGEGPGRADRHAAG